MRMLGLVAGSLAVVSGVLAQELLLRDTPQGKLFGSERFAVRLDPQTGWAGDVLCDGQAVVLAPDTKQVFDIKQDEKWVTGGGAAIEGLGVERVAADTVRSRMRAGEWTVGAYVQLFPEARLVRRWFEVEWQGSADTKIKAFWVQGGALPLGGSGGYFIPAQYPPRRVAAAELVANRRSNSGRSPHPVIGETGRGWSAVWVNNELADYADRGSAGVQEGEGQIRVTQSFNTLGHVRKGSAQKVGDAWLWLQPNDGETALRRMGEWFRLVGQTPPEDRPEWLKRVVLYSFHPGGTIGSGCKDLGGFRAAAELLPHIRDLGCNAIWLMPLEDKSIYWPRDYYKFQEGLGTGDDYKALTAKAHGLDMRVWQDCVPHGGGNQFQRAKDHPEWLAQNEDGSTLDYWCFDFNWPTWIDYMSNVVSFYTSEYSLDGFRIDAVSGSKIPNWNPAIPYARASHAQAQGGLAMQRALRRAVKAARPDGANLAEAGESIHGAVSDSTYDFDLCYRVLHDFRKLPAEAYVPQLRRWLHEQSYAEIPDLVRMRHVESHDSLRSGLWYGADAQRALVALIAWIHGIPMVYHEMEDGSYDVYRRIFHVRHGAAELSAGAADYLSVSAPAGVFACLRTGSLPEKSSAAWSDDYAWDTAPKGGARASVVLVNLGGKPVRGAVSVPDDALPAALRGAAWARDLMTGEKVRVKQGSMEVALAPFGYTVLRFESKMLPELAPARLEGAGAGRKESRGGAAVEVKGKSGALRVDLATGFADAWRAGGETLAAGLDVALPAGLAAGGTSRVSRLADGAVEVVRPFGGRTLTLRYAKAGDGVEVRAAWAGGAPEGAALVFDVPGAERWFAATAEGVFESPFRVRHPGFDGAIGSIYRLPQGTATLWDSRLHPFGLDAAHASVGAVRGGRNVAFGFDPSRLPASVRVLDRIGGDRGMRVLMAWRGDDHGVSSGGDELVFTLRSEKAGAPAGDGGTGDARLTAAGGGWTFENAHYRARVGRSGALAGLWRKEGAAWRRVARGSALYSDRGFMDGKRLSQEDDVEASARIERSGSSLRLTFSGELRGFYRFDKMAHPIRFVSAYTFGDGPAFRRACAFEPDAASSEKGAFLSLITNLEGVESASFADGAGEFLSGGRGDGKARYAQTAKSAEPKRLPTEVRLSGPGGLALRLSDLTWSGMRPANLFLHGDDLHLAWMDGAPDNSGMGRWHGVSMSVSCEAVTTAAAEPLPWAGDSSLTELLRDGGFEAEAAGALTLARSGLVLPEGEKDVRRAWQLPEGGVVACEGGSRCAALAGDGAGYRMMRQPLPPQVFEAGSVWRLKARLKGAGVETGDEGWKTACLRWALMVGGRTRYVAASLPSGDSEWREVSVEMTVPEGLTAVSAEAGLNGNRGRLWVDDVRIEKVAAGEAAAKDAPGVK